MSERQTMSPKKKSCSCLHKVLEEKLAPIYRNWYRPIEQNWPLLLAYIVVIGWQSLTRNPVPRWMLIFFHAYLVASLVTWCGRRWIKISIYTLIYTLFFIEISLEYMFGMDISPNALTLLVETNLRESEEFLSVVAHKPQLQKVLSCFICILCINIFLEFKKTLITQTLVNRAVRRLAKVVAGVFLLGGIIFGYEYVTLFQCTEVNDVDEWRSHFRNPDDIVTKSVIAFYDLYLSKKEMDVVMTLLEGIRPEPQAIDGDTLTIVLVIGESYIREHAALYGYPLQTTPFLSQEEQCGRLFVFCDVVSPYNQTTRVIRNLFSCNSIGDGESWASSPPFTSIYKKNGYYVTLYDNQKNFGREMLFSFSLNTYLYHPRIVEHCYDEVNDTTFEYDGQMIDFYELSQAKTPPRKQLLIFHLLGQHATFSSRYPSSYTHFTADSTNFRKESWLTPTMRGDIAHYDNATRYNDDVMRKIIQLYSRKNSVVIYFSDHGEEVYDYRENYGRDAWGLGNDPQQVLRWQYAVPFVVWCSDTYIRKYPETVKQLSEHRKRPLMLDNVCHLLFHLSGLNTKYYHTERDILSPSYSCPPRLINEQVDYDKIMNTEDVR